MIKEVNKIIFRSLILFSLVFFSCTSDKKKTTKQSNFVDKKEHDVFVCSRKCENGMNYYVEGKCDICHVNLVKQE